MPKFNIEVTESRSYSGTVVIEAPDIEAAKIAARAEPVRAKVEWHYDGHADVEIRVSAAPQTDDAVVGVNENGRFFYPVIYPRDKKA